jgi:hypothetical protein
MFFATEMRLSLGEPESLIGLPFEGCLSVEVLCPLLGEGNSFLCIVSGEPVQVGLVL